MSTTVMNEPTQPALAEVKIHRLYTKNSLFEATTLTIALLEHPPEPLVDMQLSVNSYPQGNGVYEAVLTLEVKAKHQDSLLWRVHYQQAGLYTLQGFIDGAEKRVLHGYCMNSILMPVPRSIGW